MDKVKRFDIVALGELLIDFTDSGRSPDGMKLFEQNPGGAPANMLTAASHMGFKTAFIGKVGCDMHGSFLIDTLRKENIETKTTLLRLLLWLWMRMVRELFLLLENPVPILCCGKMR